jgi:hypothetical protein
MAGLFLGVWFQDAGLRRRFKRRVRGGMRKGVGPVLRDLSQEGESCFTSSGCGVALKKHIQNASLSFAGSPGGG